MTDLENLDRAIAAAHADRQRFLAGEPGVKFGPQLGAFLNKLLERRTEMTNTRGGARRNFAGSLGRVWGDSAPVL